MTRSKALQFLLASAMVQILIAASLLALDNAAGWAFFTLGTVCICAFLASIGVDVAVSLRSQSDKTDGEFDL